MSWTIIEQSKVSETQYAGASYSTGLSLVADQLLSSITQQTVGATPATYGTPGTGIASTSSGNGTGATFIVTVGTGGTVTTLIVDIPGSGYALGDTITIASALIGFGGDLIITLTISDFGTDGSGGIVAQDNTIVDSSYLDISGYTAGSITFSIDPAPDSQTGGMTNGRLSTAPDALLSSITTPVANAVGPFPRTYTGIVPTGGSGTGVVLSITVSNATTVSSITATSPGSGYAALDVLTVPASALGTGSTGPIITLQADDIQAAWVVGSTLEIQIMGNIAINNFVATPLEILKDNPNSTFNIDWTIPLEKVALRVNNNTTISTGQTITVSSIFLSTESDGDGIGQVHTTGATIGPGGIVPEIQFNDGVFGGASGALYDKTANATTGQIKLANGSVTAPTLAFSSGTHPSGNYRTGMYRKDVNEIGFSCGGLQTGALLNSNSGDFIKGLNVGTTGNIGGIKRLSATAANSWEDGNCGNSEFLYFSPADFLSDDETRFAQPNALESFTLRNPATTAAVVANANNVFLIACKLIPKGFKIINQAGDDGSVLTVWCQFTSALVAANAEFSLAAISILDGTHSLQTELRAFPGGTFSSINSGVIPMILTWNGGYTSSITGDGQTFLTLWFNPTVALNNGTTPPTGLMGARIRIFRA